LGLAVVVGGGICAFALEDSVGGGDGGVGGACVFELVGGGVFSILPALVS